MYTCFPACSLSPLLFTPPSFLPPLPHTHTDTHTSTDTGVLVWSPILLVTKTSFCSCFGLHARPVALPAPTFLRATLFCGSSLISLQFSFVGLFFSVSDLPSLFAWPLCAFSSVNVWVTDFFRKIKEKKKRNCTLFRSPTLSWTGPRPRSQTGIVTYSSATLFTSGFIWSRSSIISDAVLYHVMQWRESFNISKYHMIWT